MSQDISASSRPAPNIPAGFVGREEAARISGIGITAWERWEAEGKLTCGHWLTLPWGGRLRIYPLDAVRQVRRDLDEAFPPPGTVDRHEAARIFGVAARTFSGWQTQGRITCGRLVSVPGRPGQQKVYPVEELRRLAEAFKQVPTWPPPGFVGLDDARRMFGKSRSAWLAWERQEKVNVGELFPIPGAGGQCKLYPVDALQRLKAEFDRQAERAGQRLEPYADPDRPGAVRVPVSSAKHAGMAALVDAADLPRVQGKRWNWSPGSKARGGSVVLAMGDSPKPSLARVVLGIDDPEQLVSHLNGDRLDCRRENLVVRTRSQVKRASKKVMSRAGRPCASRFKGVTRSKGGRKWQAMIHVGGQYRNLGRFRSEVDAALAYDAALRELADGDALGLNLPDPAEAERLRALEPVVEDDPTWPPPGMVDRNEACAMFGGVSLTTWMVWERRGRITCGQFHRLPNDKPGRCKLYPKAELERARVGIEKVGKPYADPDRPGVWRVPLKGYLDYREVLIDESDLPVVAGRNWNWSPRSDDDGRTEGVVTLATTDRQTPLHRIIAGVTDPKTRVAFVNGDALDCRRANLAVRTLAETVQGTRKAATRAGKDCTSQFKGVHWQPDRGLWSVQIRKGGVGMNLGRFENEADAALAYDAAARVLFGEHGHLNFPDRPSTEQAMADARAAMDDASGRKRAERRRQRDIERELRRAAAEATPPVDRAGADGVGVTISRDTAEQLFDVPCAVWRRWQSFGWLPAAATVEGQAVYPLAEIARLLSRCGIVALPYPDPQRPGCFRVPLCGETAQGREALIDAEAVPLVQTRRWRFSPTAVGRGGEVQTMIPSENVRLHYVVMGMTGDAQLHIGHRNDDPLDCRRENLVVRTLTDTHANQRKQATFCGRPCTSRFKGVHWSARQGRWVASIKKERVQRRLGSFRDEIAAAQAYDEAAREWFGEHARPNFPDGVDAWLQRAAAA
jgi:hypothetical protein